MQTLRKVVGALDELDEEAVIYTDGTSPAARAVARHEGEAAEAKAAGLRYVLEVASAKDAVDVWSAWRDGSEPTVDDKLMAISHYARRRTFRSNDGDERSVELQCGRPVDRGSAARDRRGSGGDRERRRAAWRTTSPTSRC